MVYDAHKNFAVSLVATAPSPASSGTSLVVTAADGTKFPAAPFNATIWPANSRPTTSNAEIVRVTAISTDTFTITRAQESSSARTVVVGDQIAATVTVQTITDIEAAAPAGVIQMYGASSAPTGWLLCDGTSYVRTGAQAALFAAIGTTYGSADGTHFNVPDLRGRVPVGFAASGGHTDVATLSNNEGSTLANRRPKHPHALTGAPGVGTLALPNHTHPQDSLTAIINDGAGGAWNTGNTGGGDPAGGTTGNPSSLPAITGAPTAGTLAVGASGTANDAPAYLVVNYIIKL